MTEYNVSLKMRLYAIAARVYRLLLFRVKVIVITGSCGKTLGKDVIYHVLSSRMKGIKTRQTLNGFFTHVNALFRSRPLHRFCVMEAGAYQSGFLSFLSQQLPPDVGVVLNAGYDHYREFRGPDLVAAEKQAVVEYTKRGGLAVLNVDDPRVLAMADTTKACVMTFGVSAPADIRAENIRASWPDRLSFDIVMKDQRVPVQTRLCGSFWVTSLLPAVAVAVRAGMTVEDIAAAMASFDPPFQRMWPVTMPDQVTYILDDWKASNWTLDQTISFMAEAKATRKIMVLGSISDHTGATSRAYLRIAKKAADVVDRVIITGQKSKMAVNAGKGTEPGKVQVIPELREVGDYLAPLRTPGTLIMLKGTTKLDHLHRLMLHHQNPISCWRMDCRINFNCQPCPELYRRERVAP